MRTPERGSGNPLLFLGAESSHRVSGSHPLTRSKRFRYCEPFYPSVAERAVQYAAIGYEKPLPSVAGHIFLRDAIWGDLLRYSGLITGTTKPMVSMISPVSIPGTNIQVLLLADDEYPHGVEKGETGSERSYDPVVHLGHHPKVRFLKQGYR